MLKSICKVVKKIIAGRRFVVVRLLIASISFEDAKIPLHPKNILKIDINPTAGIKVKIFSLSFVSLKLKKVAIKAREKR